jgi:protein phosphatase
MKIQLEFGYAIDQGRKRNTSPNQDSLIILKYPDTPFIPPILVVADGMGGYTGGAAASQIIVKTFHELYASPKLPFSFIDFCKEGLEIAHRKMVEKAESDSEFGGMGSTVVVGSIEKDKLNVMNVGDSRAYLLHKGNLRQVNYDHSFVGEAIRAGIITHEEAMTHPKRNQLTQSVSARKLDITPFFAQHRFEAGDILLLCTDGLWGVVAESMIVAVLNELPAKAAAEKLVELANSRGGPDNISVIVCKSRAKRLINIGGKSGK